MEEFDFAVEQENEKKQHDLLKRKRLTSFAGVVAKTLSVLTAYKISVHVTDRPEIQAPAYSSTKDVWFNLSEIKDNFTARSITSLYGLSFHELGHLRYTARNGSTLVGLIKDNQESNELWQAFNCLEDSRIEFLLTGWLPSIKSWLTATMVDYLLYDDEAITRAFPLVYGRKYLPVELRQLASDNFIKPEIQQDMADVIDDYNSLVMTGNDEHTDHAFSLIKKFAELLNELPPFPQDPEGGCGGYPIIVRIKNPNGHGCRPIEGYESSSNRPVKRSEQERNSKSAGKNVIEVIIDTTPKEDTESGEGESEPTTEGKNPQHTQSPSTPSPVDDEDEFDDEDDFGDEEDYFSPPSQSQSKGAGKEKGQTGSNTQVTDTLNDILSDVIDTLTKDINSIANQIGVNPGLEGGNAETPDKARYTEVEVPTELSNIARGFGVELERLRADFDPAWISNESTGKLNAQRYLLGADLDSVFDSWEEGRDDVTSVEAVILLDRSGSMSGRNADEAYKSMWAIKKALERVEARTTVVTFDSHTALLYGADEKAGITIRDAGANGGTDPRDSILFAKKVLAESDKAIKILFMITDGSWDSKKGESAVVEMKQAGVLTCQALISGYPGDSDSLNDSRHGFELITSIRSAKDILVLGKELVRLAIARNLVKA